MAYRVVGALMIESCVRAHSATHGRPTMPTRHDVATAASPSFPPEEVDASRRQPAEQGYGGDDHRGDERDQKPVLDGCRALPGVAQPGGDDVSWTAYPVAMMAM